MGVKDESSDSLMQLKVSSNIKYKNFTRSGFETFHRMLSKLIDLIVFS